MKSLTEHFVSFSQLWLSHWGIGWSYQIRKVLLCHSFIFHLPACCLLQWYSYSRKIILMLYSPYTLRTWQGVCLNRARQTARWRLVPRPCTRQHERHCSTHSWQGTASQTIPHAQLNNTITYIYNTSSCFIDFIPLMSLLLHIFSNNGRYKQWSIRQRYRVQVCSTWSLSNTMLLSRWRWI